MLIQQMSLLANLLIKANALPKVINEKNRKCSDKKLLLNMHAGA